MRGESPDMEPSLDCWFSIFLLYIWSPHLVTKQSGVPSGILGVLIPSYPLKKDDFRNHFIIIQKNTTQWTQPTVAGSIIIQPIRNHEIWNKKHTAKSKGKPLKIVSNKLQVLFVYSSQTNWVQYVLPRKISSLQDKKNVRLCRGFACPHHPDSLAAWDHDMVAAPLKKSWLPQGGGQRMVQRCPLCWAENVQFFIWDTLSLGVPSFFFGISLHDHRVSKSKFCQKSANNWNNWTTGSFCTKLLELLLTSVCDSCVFHA